MRFSKSSVKLTLCAGRLPNKQSHVLFKKQAHPVKRIHFTDVKTTQTISNDFSTILVQKDFKNGLKLRSQPLQSKEIKYLQKFDSKGLPKGYQAVNGFLAKLQKQVPLFKQAKSRKNIPDKAVSNCKSKEGILNCVSFWHKKGFSQWSKSLT